MVNVGGRSKGCSSCRKRRVKCDEVRPVCNRCRRVGLECDIGDRDITFVEARIVKSRHRAPQPTRLLSDNNGMVRHAILTEPSLAGLQFEMSICYAMRHLGRGRAIDLRLRRNQLSDIITVGTDAGSTLDQIFPKTVLSFATIVFGVEHRQSSITDQGYVLLGGALKQLNQALLEPQCYARDEVIISVATLAILEALVPTAPDNFLKHMLGLDRLLGLRDPTVFCSDESIELYKSVRHMILFASLKTRKASMLAMPTWKAVMRKNCSKQDLLEADLFEVLADCTVLMAERNDPIAEYILDGKHHARQDVDILQRTQALLDGLESWKARLNIANQKLYIPNPKHVENRGEPYELYEFAEESAATLTMFYNTTVIYVLRILESLAHSSNSARSHYAAAARIAAIEVCRCVPCWAKIRLSQSHPCSSPVTHWAIANAYATLSSSEDNEHKRMVELLNVKGRLVTARALMPD